MTSPQPSQAQPPVPPEDSSQTFLQSFSDPQAVARYVEGPPRYTPGLAALHRMSGLLLAERAPAAARVLVLGAGGGLELKALAEAWPDWTFVGVDPAAEMLALAAKTAAPYAERIELVQGYIDDAPPGPFDAATCLLTLHFLDREARVETARALRARLRPGAPCVVAHASFPQEPGAREAWLSRYAAFALASGADPEQVEAARAAVSASRYMFSPEEDEAVLNAAGFTDVALFYAAFTWRGWVGYA
ncbi:MAG: class I SAM-dependent methyltransferase [Phenylobacterium sp.]|jgi:tRNA (cmo5U34)-methyltransferase|uniref:class I SAM-dependent methyltransferase n=1 Tax=Phenylobacterium sp. TaxID=1871053 RepID=UPI003919C9C5